MSVPGFVCREAFRAARRVCRGEILRRGVCEVPGFLQPWAVAKCLKAAEALRRTSGGFRSFEEHNVYLEDGAAGAKGVRGVRFASSKVLINQQELAEGVPELLELFRWDGLRALLQEAFGLPQLFCSADPLGGVYLNFFERGDQLGWHFDRSEYSVNLILRECPRTAAKAGQFMYLPDSRPFIDARVDDFDVAQLGSGLRFDGLSEVVEPDLQPGTLYLFAGNRSLHCVSENTTDVTRVNAIFTFNPQPDVALNAYTRRKFFGR